MTLTDGWKTTLRWVWLMFAVTWAGLTVAWLGDGEWLHALVTFAFAALCVAMSERVGGRP